MHTQFFKWNTTVKTTLLALSLKYIAMVNVLTFYGLYDDRRLMKTGKSSNSIQNECIFIGIK